MKTSNYSSTVSEEQLIDGEINPEILEILGLEDVFDLDQDDYMSLLKEAIVKANQGLINLTEHQLAILANERARIRDKKNIKFNSKKINASSFFNKKDEETNKIVDPKRILPPSGGIKPDSVKKEDEGDETKTELENLRNFLTKDLFNSIKDIASIVKNIEFLLEDRNNLLKKESESERKESVKSGFRGKESELESKKKESTFGGILSKVTKPFNSLFDTIRNFLMNVLVGSLLNWLLSVLEDPRKLLQPIQDLLDGIFNFFNNIIDWMDNTFVNPIRYLIDTVNSGISGFIDILNNALSLIPGATPIEAPQLSNIPEPQRLEAPDIVGRNEKSNTELPDTNIQTRNKGGLILNLKKSGGSVTNNNILNTKKTNLVQNTYNKELTNSVYDPISEKGGKVNYNTGLRISGLEPDTQLTALKKDEYVLVPGAARALGINRLDALNKKFGGDNKERSVSLGDKNIKLLSGGGRVVTSPAFVTRNINGVTSGMHMGADVQANYEPLKAYIDGKVESTSPPSRSAGYGPKWLIWKGSDGRGHMFAHMSQLYVKPGDNLRKGQKVGISGSYGTGPHLHWEVSANPNDVGQDKSSKRSRLNPIDLFGVNAPFGGDIRPGEGSSDIASSPTDSSTQTSDSPPQESEPQVTREQIEKWLIRGDPANPRNKGFLPLDGATNQISNSASVSVSQLLPSAQTPGGTQGMMNRLRSGSNRVVNQTTNNILQPKYNIQQLRETLKPAAQTPGGTQGMMNRFTPASQGPKIPSPPSSSSSGNVKMLPIPAPASSGKSGTTKSGALTGRQGSTVPEFPSVNYSELAHIGAVRSVLGVMEN